jgi:very-short-patch-repair endonuclease
MKTIKHIVINGITVPTRYIPSLPYNELLKDRARKLRRNSTLSEVLFWVQVNKKKFHGIDFDRQKIIGNYIVDFFCTNCNVVIEIDGSSHDDKQEYDAVRDDYLKSFGLEVIHINDIDVKKNLNAIMTMLYNHPSLLHPLPLFEPPRQPSAATPPKEANFRRQFSEEAKDVFEAGLALWKYYHKQPHRNVNASLYDIREHFQGRNEKGTMNNKSNDETYNTFNDQLRITLKTLAMKIEQKVYEYGFLKK